MGYEIIYGGKRQLPRWDRGWTGLACAFFGLFLLLVWGFWPEGREAMRTMLWYGDGEIALEAAEVFVESIQCGLSFTDAAELFCIQVLSGAGFAG